MQSKFGSSPVGSPATRKAPTKAREELMKSLFEFFALEPTTAELEMMDMILSAAMWSYEGYELFYHTANIAHRIVHKEDSTWKKKTIK
ncbi:MAG: hypothetical protein ACXABD_18705 [Candidatus Thorarchaeota archaeon]|jgi:hypothetical protein